MKEHLRSYMGYVTSKLSYQQWMKSDTSVSYPTTLLMNFHRIFMIARVELTTLEIFLLYWIRRNVEERVSNIKVPIDRLYSTDNGWTLGLKGSWIRTVDQQAKRKTSTDVMVEWSDGSRAVPVHAGLVNMVRPCSAVDVLRLIRWDEEKTE